MNKIVIAGGSGFIGRHLTSHFTSHQQEVVVLTRHPKETNEIKWDGETVGEWKNQLENASAVINLSGASIITHWSDKNKLQILQSRLNSTKAIGEAITQCENPPGVWINGSAVGYYGDRKAEELDESSTPGQKGSFEVDTCVAWEHAQWSVCTEKTRQVRIRSGITLGSDGGAFQKMYTLAKYFLGGHFGSGEQSMSWIHIDDLCALFQWCIDKKISGPVNGTAPNPVRNAEFMLILRSVLKRPWSPPVPAFVLKLIAMCGGPEASLLLESQRALPKAALDSGFQFKFPHLLEAIVDLCAKVLK